MSCDDWLHVENDAPGGTFLWKTCGYCGELRFDPCFPHIECGKLSFPFHGHTVAGLRRLQQPVQHAVRLPDAIDPSGSSRPGSIRVLHAAHQHQPHLGACHGHIEHTSPLGPLGAALLQRNRALQERRAARWRARSLTYPRPKPISPCRLRVRVSVCAAAGDLPAPLHTPWEIPAPWICGWSSHAPHPPRDSSRRGSVPPRRRHLPARLPQIHAGRPCGSAHRHRPGDRACADLPAAAFRQAVRRNVHKVRCA